jgi:hypothetical protein
MGKDSEVKEEGFRGGMGKQVPRQLRWSNKYPWAVPIGLTNTGLRRQLMNLGDGATVNQIVPSAASSDTTTVS